MIDDHENLGMFLQQLGGSLELMPSMGFSRQSPHEIHRKIVEDGGVWHIYTTNQCFSISYHYHAHFHYQFHVHDHCFYHHVIHHIFILYNIYNSCYTCFKLVCLQHVSMSFPSISTHSSRVFQVNSAGRFRPRHGLSCMSKLRL